MGSVYSETHRSVKATKRLDGAVTQTWLWELFIYLFLLQAAVCSPPFSAFSLWQRRRKRSDRQERAVLSSRVHTHSKRRSHGLLHAVQLPRLDKELRISSARKILRCRKKTKLILEFVNQSAWTDGEDLLTDPAIGFVMLKKMLMWLNLRCQNTSDLSNMLPNLTVLYV